MKNNSKYQRIAQIFFNPETLVPFIVGAVFLSILGNAVTNFIFSLLGVSPVTSLLVALGAVLIFGVSVVLFGKGLEKLPNKNLIPNKEAPAKHGGLILLVSNFEACQKAIEYHSPNLKYCWTICSDKTLEIATKLRGQFPEIKFSDPLVINDVYDPLSFYKKVKKIYDNLPRDLSKAEVISDFTGMTAHASVGMVLACLAREYELQYTPANLDESGRPIGSLDPIEIVLKRKK